METGKDPITGKFQKNNKAGAGRPRGSKSTAQILLEQIGTDSAETIMKKIIEQALTGDFQAQKLILDRIYPAPKARTFTTFKGKRNIHAQKDIDDAMNEVLSRAMSSGADQLSLEEAESLTSLLIKKKETMDECLHGEVIEMQKKIGMI